jgi:hypothetical protein
LDKYGRNLPVQISDQVQSAEDHETKPGDRRNFDQEQNPVEYAMALEAPAVALLPFSAFGQVKGRVGLDLGGSIRLLGRGDLDHPSTAPERVQPLLTRLRAFFDKQTAKFFF